MQEETLEDFQDYITPEHEECIEALNTFVKKFRENYPERAHWTDEDILLDLVIGFFPVILQSISDSGGF